MLSSCGKLGRKYKMIGVSDYKALVMVYALAHDE